MIVFLLAGILFVLLAQAFVLLGAWAIRFTLLTLIGLAIGCGLLAIGAARIFAWLFWFTGALFGFTRSAAGDVSIPPGADSAVDTTIAKNWPLPQGGKQ